MFKSRGYPIYPQAPGAEYVDELQRKFGPVPVQPTPGIVEDGSGQPEMIVPLRKRTQEDQNHADDVARRKAMKELVQSWMDRLQLISVITTFFASVEAGLLQVTTPDSKNNVSRVDQTANACLVGALIMHVFAAVISFLAAFFLIRYKLKEAKNEELKLEEHMVNHNTEPPDIERGSMPPHNMASAVNISPPAPVKRATASEPPIWTTDPHLEQVGPFRKNPPTHLLARCHSLCVFFAFVGFFLALLGIIFYVWARHPLGVSVFASVCMASCTVGMVGILVVE